jgi:hypothetical protein
MFPFLFSKAKELNKSWNRLTKIISEKLFIRYE